MFLAPVFYPITAVPERFRPFIMANPLTFIIDQAREVLIWGHLPNWMGLGIYTLAATLVAWVGYAWFKKPEKGLPMSSNPTSLNMTNISIRVCNTNKNKCYHSYQPIGW
jgi:hypothetical protein